LPVGEAPACPLKWLGLLDRQPLPELAHKSGLAEACISDDRDQQRSAALDHLSVRGPELCELPFPPYEDRMEATHPARALEREGAYESSSGYSLRLALGFHSLRLGELEGTPDG
jgi:hypothetical protein